jgi:hypothetical protein
MKLILALILLLVPIMIAGGLEEPPKIVQASDVLANIRAGQPAEYDDCVIVGELDLSGLEVSKPIHFNHTIFQNAAGFYSTSFNNPTYFNGTQFNSYAIFSESQFNRTAYFNGTLFNSVAIFEKSKFIGDADFYGSQFKGDGSEDNWTASFCDTQFNEDADFRRSLFNGTTGFYDSKFSGDADFSESQLNNHAYFGGSQFTGSVLDCDSISDHIFDKSTYLSLIKNLKDHGQFNEADNCYYSFRYQYMSSAFDYLSWISCGFGVRWTHTIAFGVGILTIFGFIYLFKAQPINIKAINRIKLITKRKLYESLFFSLIILISAPSDLYPYGSKKYNNFITRNRYIILTERIFGWSLLILLINTVSRVMIRY